VDACQRSRGPGIQIWLAPEFSSANADLGAASVPPSLMRYHLLQGESNMYAVKKNEGCTVRYVEVAGKHLVLRPHNNAHPVEVMPMQHGKKPPDYLIGRICYVGIET